MKSPIRYQFINYTDTSFDPWKWSKRSDEIIAYVEENNIEYLSIRRHATGEFIEVFSVEDATLLKLVFGVEDLIDELQL